jgi:hypothetical protein
LSSPADQTTWKDYLRVALPAIGLVLIAALFFLWARDLFGDDPIEPAGTASPVAQIATVPPPTPTATAEVNLEATEVGEDSGGGDGTPSDDQDDPECESDLAKADKVVVTEEEVRMRAEPDTTQDNVVETLSAGTELVIVGDCFVEDDEGNVFWQVRNESTTNTGYVAAAFLVLATEDE